MRITVVAKEKYDKKELVRCLSDNSCTFVQNDPEFVISWGGDGTFLIAERKFPGIPKVMIRDSNICVKCEIDSIHELFHKLAKHRVKFEEHSKLLLTIKGEKILATNDIILRNRNPQQAIRFTVQKDKSIIGMDEIIGDGIVIATTFGATAYFNSITRKTFKRGVGIAFNNTVKQIPPTFIGKRDKIKITVARGPAILTFDNSRKQYILDKGDYFTSSISSSTARIVRFH